MNLHQKTQEYIKRKSERKISKNNDIQRPQALVFYFSYKVWHTVFRGLDWTGLDQ